MNDSQSNTALKIALICVCATFVIVGAAAAGFLIWGSKLQKAAMQTPTIAPVVQTPTAAAITDEPLAEPTTVMTPEPTDKPTEEPTPQPTATPLYLGVDTSLLNYKPREDEYFNEPRELMTVVQGTMNIRSGPDKSYTELGNLEMGDKRMAYAASSSWFLIEYADGCFGWASGKLTIADWMFDTNLNSNLYGIDRPDYISSSPWRGMVTYGTGANLKTGPASSRTTAMHLDYEKAICFISQRGDWYFVNSQGNYGWVHKDAFVTPDSCSINDGNYLYYFDGKNVRKADGFYIIDVDIHAYTVFSVQDVQNVANGQTITKHGFTLEPSMLIDSAANVISDSADHKYIEIDRGYMYYDSSEKGYIISVDSDDMITYRVKSAVLVLDPDLRIDEMEYCNYMDATQEFSSSERSRYHYSNEHMHIDPEDLEDYLDKLDDIFGFCSFFGEITIKNGLVTKMNNWPQD